MEKRYYYWQTISLQDYTCWETPSPFHKQLPLTKEHLECFMETFTFTKDELFTGVIVEEAKLRTNNMAKMFHCKIDNFKKTAQKQNLLNLK